MPTPHGLRGQTKAQTGEVSQVPLTFAPAGPVAATKAELLKQRLGYDPRESSTLRVAYRESRGPVEGLSQDVEAQLAKINASPHVKSELKGEDVYVHTLEAGSNRFVADRYCFLGNGTLRRVAAVAEQGFAFMTRHATGGWIGDGENPCGQTFAAVLEQKGAVSRVVLQVYLLRDFYPNGRSAVGTDDLHKGMMGGIFRDVSLGLCASGEERVICDVCERDLYDNECRHIPGYTIGMSPEDVAKQKARGVPEGRASYTMEDFSASEVSLVYDGAIPNAGTAYSKAAPVAPPAIPAEEITTPTETAAAELAVEKPHVAAEPLTEEPMKYSKEVKLSLGLKEDATDEQVEARLAALRSAETENATFKQSAEAEKARADKAEAEAFTQKWAGKLAASVIDRLAKLPSADRDALAADLAAQTKEETVVPPIDGLANTAAAAAPAAKNLSSTWTDRDEAWRQGLGVVESREEVERLLSLSPVALFNKVFGTKLGETDYSRHAVKHRLSVFGMQPVAVK